ncbi:MAG: 2-amino-4-hydroxy-6-hydroxymethyldihydropteridine diphosphokinase [Actinomycetota bacterium]|nr:2-amino-4-hydroxy-6-hydroxymethyldihydropteridine diphosphokinase [Actinomycetota bacterium]
MAIGYLGLGSNVGERRAHLEAALRELDACGVVVLHASSVYDTEPVGLFPDQPDFLNACVEMETELQPEALLDVCKAVEHAVGRRGGGPRHGPRVIDVDVLLLGALRHRSPRLTLPHPEVSSRRFVLVPLLELDPGLALPDGTPLATALAALPAGQAVRMAGPPLRVGGPPLL